MSRKLILFLLLGFLPIFLQSQELVWMYKMGGTSADVGTAITLDNNQSVLDVTNFSGSVTVSGIISYTSRGSQDIVLRKSSASGIYQWSFQIGSKSMDTGYDITTDSEGNGYIIGTFSDSLFLNNTFLLKGDNVSLSSFIIKFNSNGGLIWSTRLVSDVAIIAKTITRSQNSEMIISGIFEGNVSFGAGVSIQGKGGGDCFLIKINGGDGTSHFALHYGGHDNETVDHHFTDNQGNFYLVGEYRQNVDFDPGPGTEARTSNGMSDGYILKLSPVGKFVWVRTLGGTGLDQAASVATDGQRNVVVTGSFSANVQFSQGGMPSASKGGTDMFLLKMDENGNTLWNNTFGDTLNDAGTRVLVNANGIIYLVGNFRLRVDFNPSQQFNNSSESMGGTDGFIGLFNQDGSYNEHFTIGGMANEQINDIALKSNGELISVGGFGVNVDFDPSSSEAIIFSTGGIDGFVWNTFVCVNPYIKSVKAFKPVVCHDENILIQILEGYLNSATQWSWQRGSCNSITFASGNFLSIPIDTSTSFYVKGFGGCVTNDECKKIDIKVFKDSLVYNDVNLCQGDTLKVGNSRYTAAGTYTDSLLSVSGCDSIVFTEIFLYPKYFSSQSLEICDGDTVWVGDTPLTFAGTFSNVFPSIYGCDSIIVTNLNVLPTSVQNAEAIICKGESVTIGSETYTDTGTYFQTSVSTNGCEDILIVKVTSLETEFAGFANICEGESVKVGNSTYTQSGVYVDSLVSSFGCDSIITTTVVSRPNPEVYFEYSLCQGDSLVIGNHVHFNSGIFTDTLPTIFGCDSIIVIDINVLPVPPVTDQSLKICEGQSVSVGPRKYTTQGTYRDTLQSANGCDSIVITRLQVFKKNYSQQAFICNGETYTVGGMSFTSSGTYNINLKNNAGCDSIIMLTLNVENEKFFNQTKKICPGNVVVVGGNSYNQPGVYKDTLNTALGCDSIVTTTLIYNHVFVPVNRSICQGSFVVINSKVYNTAGNFTDVIIKPDGCDSTLNITIKVNPVYEVDTLFEICKGESVTVGTSTYFNPGKYTEILSTVGGCDSTVHFEIQVVNFVPVFFTVKDTLRAFNIPGAQYQWHECINNEKVPILGATQSFFPLFKSGSYALSITYRGCTYISSCEYETLTATGEPIDELPFVLSPNPANSFVEIKSSIAGEFVLRSADGKVAVAVYLPQGTNRIDVSTLPAGIYIAAFRNKKTIRSQILVIGPR